MTVTPEKVADVDEGASPELELGGMTAEELATFEAMRAGRDVPVTDGGDDAGAADDTDAGVVDAAGSDDADDADTGASGDDSRTEAPEGDKRAPPKTINYHKHLREIRKRDDAAAALQAKLDGATQETRKEREERLRLDERTKMLLDAISAKPKAETTAAPKEEPDPEPNVDDDPLAHSAWTSRELRRTQKIIQDIQSGQTKQQETSAAEREEREVYSTFTADLEREAQADPTFGEAFVHLRESRYRELGAIYAGIDITDPAQCATLSTADQAALSQNIQRAFHNEQMLVAREAMKKGVSPAKSVKFLAVARGFAPKAAETVPAKTNGVAKTNGATKPAVNGQGRPTVGQELQAIREGQAASKSLSDASGSPGGTITPERIAEMSNEEFEEFYASIPKSQFDRMMGKVPQ
jgi:hypothetical protein